MICIIKLGKNPALSSSYRHINLLDTIGKLFEQILLPSILYEISERGLMRDEQFGFRPGHMTSLHVELFFQRITRNFSEKG